MTCRYARNRFKRGMVLREDEVVAFEDYFYHIMAARGSGEHALRHLLGPFAWAKHPLEGRLHYLKVAHTSSTSLVFAESWRSEHQKYGHLLNQYSVSKRCIGQFHPCCARSSLLGVKCAHFSICQYGQQNSCSSAVADEVCLCAGACELHLWRA